MMKLKEMQAAAAALGNQLAAGVPAQPACQRMIRFQPAYAEFWGAAAAGVGAGRPLSEFLSEQWPEALVSAVKAGEESGSVAEVLDRIEQIIELQREMYKLVMQLAYPIVSGVLGLAVFVFFMLWVIPALSSGLGVGQHGLVFEVSTWMRATVDQHGIGVGIGLAAAVGGCVHWLSGSKNRAKLAELVLRMPVVGEGLTNLFFGIWAYYMALVSGAGIPVIDGLLMTSKTLPASLRIGLESLAAEAVSRGIADAADPDKQATGDARRDWPFYIPNAFLIAEETGRLDLDLNRAGKALLKEATARLKIAINVGYVVSLFVSSLLIAGPVAAYYIQLGISLADAMKG